MKVGLIELARPSNYNRENRKSFNILLISKGIETGYNYLIIVRRIKKSLFPINILFL